MSVKIIWASPNKEGLTAAAKDRILEGLSFVGTESKEIHLNKRKIRSCLACKNGWGLCRSEGRCVISDDFSEIYDELVAAEGIVLITPVYWHDMAENLKALLDRIRRCETASNHFLQGKQCLLVACAGESGRGAIRCLENLEITLNHMGVEAIDRISLVQFNKDYMLPALYVAGQSFGTHTQTANKPI